MASEKVLPISVLTEYYFWMELPTAYFLYHEANLNSTGALESNAHILLTRDLIPKWLEALIQVKEILMLILNSKNITEKLLFTARTI